MGGMMGGNEPRQFGYADGDRRVSALIDMINGGGAGRAGQRFEGGGLLSDIGNQLFRPYGFEERMGQVRPQARPMRPPMGPAAASATSPFAVDLHAIPSAPSMGGGRTAVGPQRLTPLTYGPQNGRPALGTSSATLINQLLSELRDPSTPPARRAQIEQSLRPILSMQGGLDMLDFGGL